MNKFFNRLFAGVMSLAMVAGVVSAPANTAEAKEDLKGKLVVIHTNDVHGRYEKNDESLGMSSVKALKGYYQSQGAHVLLLDAGDFSQGTNLVNYYKGLDSVYFMNEAGYDAVSLGNHEFDFGFDALQEMAAAAEFPILDANIINKETGEPYFGDNKVFEYSNMKVGVFGLDTPEAQTKANPKNVKDVNFLDDGELIACAQAQVDELKAQDCDYIICLGHLGVDEESAGRRSADVAANVTGIDLFVDGHSHTRIDGGFDINGTKIVSTGSYLEKIGVVVYDGETTKAKLVDDFYNIGGCPEMDAFVKTFADVVDEAYAGTFATTTNTLNGEKDPGVRTMETNLGDFAADAYKYIAETYVKENNMDLTIDGAIQNGGGIRASIEPGEISMNTLYTVFPFGNTISIVSVTGAELLEALEASCSACPAALGGFPQVSGIVFSVDTSVPYAQGEQYPDSTYYAPANAGSRVTIDTVGGKKFDANATYNIAVNNFMADGGDTYFVFTKASQVLDTGVVDAEGLISYVNSLNGVIGDEYTNAKGKLQNEYILQKIHRHNSSDYCKDLIDKYYPFFPVWVFVVLISFGDLAYLCDFYDKLYSDPIVNNKFMNTVRDLRNASAHSNCLINKLFEPLNPNQQIDSSISNYVKSVASVSSQARAKNLNYRIVYNFVTLLYIYDSIIPDGIAKCKRHAEIKDLFNNRMTKHKDYFKSNNKIVGIYKFLKKVVDTLPS